MASHMRHLSRSLLQIGRRIPAKRKCIQQWHCPQPQCRAFSRTTPQFADEDENLKPAVPPSTPVQLDNEVFTVEDMNPEMRADYEQLSKEEQAQALQDINRTINTMPSPEEEAELERQMKAAVREINQQIPEEYDNTPLSPREIGFWADDEDDEFAQVPDDDDEFDEADISTTAHSDLELHREMREYQRIVAWEMPLLNKFAKPFSPPSLTRCLRFRYTTYMGEVHPAARKIVVEFTTTDLAHPECANLTEPQRRKLIKIVGVRYNPDTDVVKMSCEKFEHAAQNKRYLGDLIGKIVAECKDPAADTFEDVPFDFRHHKSKKVLTYPAEWMLSPERVKVLMEVRAERRKGAGQKVLVDGRKEVQRYAQLTEGPREEERVPVMAGWVGGRSNYQV